MAKKFFIAMGIILIVAIIGLAIAPQFFDIDRKIKPILIGALEKNLNAKVSMGDVSLSLYGKVSLKIDSLKIVKDKIFVDISDLNIKMPYSVLFRDPVEWKKNIKMSITADDVAINDRRLVIKNFRSALLKEDARFKLKNTEFEIFDGFAKSYAELDFSGPPKGVFEFEVRHGKWPADQLKESLAKNAASIPRAQKMISDIDIDDTFDSLKGNILFEKETIQIRSLTMDVPQNKANVKSEGIINAKNNLKLEGEFYLPLDNVPGELRAADGRGRIPFEVLGQIDNPQLNWGKTIQIVVQAYSKEEGKKIIKKEVNRLKEKLMKNEKIKELIKGIKF